MKDYHVLTEKIVFLSSKTLQNFFNSETIDTDG